MKASLQYWSMVCDAYLHQALLLLGKRRRIDHPAQQSQHSEDVIDAIPSIRGGLSVLDVEAHGEEQGHAAVVA
jgi:hypothetical protein